MNSKQPMILSKLKSFKSATIILTVVADINIP